MTAESAKQPAAVNTVVIYTGGTFGMVENSQGLLQPASLNCLQEHLSAVAECTVWPVADSDGKPLPPLDSSAVSPAFWQALAATLQQALQQHSRAVVIHGTDTMAYTAAAMGFALGAAAQRLVFTGSQRPWFQPGSDAPANFRLALSACQQSHKAAWPQLAFAGKLLNGMRLSKAHSHADEAFIERQPYGTVAEKPEFGFERWNAVSARSPGFSGGVLDIPLTPASTVEMLYQQLSNNSVKAAVLRLYGSGTSSLKLGDVVAKAKKNNSQLAAIVAVSACHHGGLQADAYATSAFHDGNTNADIINGGSISPEAAVSKLMWLLASFENEHVAELFRLNAVGEYGG